MPFVQGNELSPPEAARVRVELYISASSGGSYVLPIVDDDGPQPASPAGSF